jgi:hypothetical protein
MRVLSKQRITISAAKKKYQEKGGMTLTVVPETSTATTMLAVYLRTQIIQLHGAPSSLITQSLMWVRFPRHLRNTRKHYRITAARLWPLSYARQIQFMLSHPTPTRSIPLSLENHGLPNGLFLQVYDSFF